MIIKLIETGNAREDSFAQCWYTPHTRKFLVPLLALPVVAALTPSHHQIEIIDEKLQDIDLEMDCDLICFSFKTKDATRTYQYADHFRNRGITVILGGVHVSSLPEEAMAHADSVVVGEAEGVWPEIVKDAEFGQLQIKYQARSGVSLEEAPIPRFDLIQNDRYCMHAIQTSRGCLVGCEFCPVQKMFGGLVRHKSVARVLAEIDAVQAIDPDKMIFFVDEMFCGGDAEYQKSLLKALRKRKIDFFCITDFKAISPAYIEDLARSGCRRMSINMPGTCLPQEATAIRAIQRLGIEVWGFFMLGFSFHDQTVFEKVVRFVEETDMRTLTLTVMSPFPNTPSDRMVSKRNAYLSKDWSLYDQCHIVFEPENLSAEALERGYLELWNRLEDRINISETTFSVRPKWGRDLKRQLGQATNRLQNRLNWARGRREEPVDLLRLVGKPKVEVAVMTHNTMGGLHAKY